MDVELTNVSQHGLWLLIDGRSGVGAAGANG